MHAVTYLLKLQVDDMILGWHGQACPKRLLKLSGGPFSCNLFLVCLIKNKMKNTEPRKIKSLCSLFGRMCMIYNCKGKNFFRIQHLDDWQISTKYCCFLGEAPTSMCHFFYLSVSLSVTHHISGTINHLIIIFGASV